MSATESDIECSTDTDSDVTDPKARPRPSLEVHKALGVRQTSMMYNCEVKVLLFIAFFFFYHFSSGGWVIDSKY